MFYILFPPSKWFLLNQFCWPVTRCEHVWLELGDEILFCYNIYFDKLFDIFNVNTYLPKKIGWYRSMEHKLPLLKRFVGWFRNWNWSFLKVWNAAWEIQIIFSVKRILQFFPKINKIEQQTNPVWKWLRILFATCGAAVWRKVGFKTWIWKC